MSLCHSDLINQTNMSQYPYTFTLSTATGDHGHQYPLLTANQYPWMNVQIVPTPSAQRTLILDALNKRGGGVATVDGRTDFVAIHPTISITRQNYQQVAAILRDCLQAAADYWAATHPVQ